MATRARSSASCSLVQRIIGGVVGGIAGDLVFGAMIGIMGMLPKVRGCWLPLPHVQQRDHRGALRSHLRHSEPHLRSRGGFRLAIRGDLVGARSVDPYAACVGDGRAIRCGLIPDEPDELDGTPDLRSHNRPGIRGIHTTTSGSLRRRSRTGLASHGNFPVSGIMRRRRAAPRLSGSPPAIAPVPGPIIRATGRLVYH